MKKHIVLLLMFVYTFSFAQSVNDYKYALVPSKFNFLNEKDEYKLNTLTKLLLEKYGFVVYLDSDVMPDELINSNCNKVYVEVVSSDSFFTTKLKIILKDCKNNILASSEEGTSRDKEYRVAYNEALRNAFKSFDTLNYKYKPSGEIGIISSQKEIANTDLLLPINTSSEVFFAQPILNGFQLVDNSPKVVMKIFSTSNNNCYIALKGNIQGVLLSKDNQWFFEYYLNEKLISEKVNVKF